MRSDDSHFIGKVEGKVSIDKDKDVRYGFGKGEGVLEDCPCVRVSVEDDREERRGKICGQQTPLAASSFLDNLSALAAGMAGGRAFCIYLIVLGCIYRVHGRRWRPASNVNELSSWWRLVGQERFKVCPGNDDQIRLAATSICESTELYTVQL